MRFCNILKIKNHIYAWFYVLKETYLNLLLIYARFIRIFYCFYLLLVPRRFREKQKRFVLFMLRSLKTSSISIMADSRGLYIQAHKCKQRQKKTLVMQKEMCFLILFVNILFNTLLREDSIRILGGSLIITKLSLSFSFYLKCCISFHFLHCV